MNVRSLSDQSGFVAQLGFDGSQTPHPMRRQTPLTGRQRELVRYMRHHAEVRPLEIGELMHASRDGFADSRYASSDGCDALRRLRRRGLVERVARGRWRLVTHDESRWTA